MRAEEVRIGALAFQGAERTIQEFGPTVAQLQRALPSRDFVLKPLDLDGMARAVAHNQVEFILTNPGQYVELEARFGATRIATLETRIRGVPMDTVGSAIVARAEGAPPKTLDDLVGLRVATVSVRGFGGYETVWREMDDRHLSPAQFGSVIETGFPMSRVLDAVRQGRADVGIVRTCLLESEIAAGRVRPGEFVVVGARDIPGFPCQVSTRLYPDWPFARTDATSRELAKFVAASLLTMPAMGEIAWTAPRDYSSVHELFRQLKIGPYRRPGQPTIQDLVRAYWGWVAAGLLAIGWWVIHVVRVESLVKRRTAELKREIIERERAEQSARCNRQQRDHYSRLGILGEMASSIAHELNQPLAAIANYAEGMTRVIDGGRLEQAILRDGARSIAGQAERAAGIIQRVRGFVRRRDASRETVDVNEVVRDALALFEGAAGRRGIGLTACLADDLPRVCIDRIEIEQVVLNLLQNAVDATIESKLPGSVTIRSYRVVNDVQIAVRDDGPGLTPSVEAHLFEPFFTTKRHGLGLGLSICRTIVESHGGRLWAAANDGSGLTMQFTLPGIEEEGTV